MTPGLPVTILACLLLTTACAAPTQHDLILRGGLLVDGSGAPGVVGDLAVDGDRISAIGDLGDAVGATEIDVSGLVVAPGFINMLSSRQGLIEDGRAQSDVRQGVTLVVFGEGQTAGPLNEEMKVEARRRQGDMRYDIGWTTLDEFLGWLEDRGTSPNVASLVGATTIRIHELGYDDRTPTDDELDRMRGLVRDAMKAGALGLGSALIYAPAFYADTSELVALAKVVAEYDGIYISHIRNEGNALLESADELITIAREADVRAEIYHLKAAGSSNWKKLEDVIGRIEDARADGLAVSANMYTYTAGSTGLDAAMPPWVQEGGYEAWAERLRDPEVRVRLRREMVTETAEWENLQLAAGADGTLLAGFRNPDLREFQGMTLAEVAALRGTSVPDTAMDLVIEDGSRVTVVYFLMSDASSLASEGVFLNYSTHPRAYGNFARLLGRYVRDEQIVALEEAVRRLTSLPAGRLRIEHRGRLEPGYYADVAVFDPQTIQDHATYEAPHQYATGVHHVFVNGTQVVKDGEHTEATPGRVVRGPGWSSTP